MSESTYEEYHRKDGCKFIFTANTLWDGSVSLNKEYALTFPIDGYTVEETAFTASTGKTYPVYSVTDTDGCLIAQYAVFSSGATNYSVYIRADESKKRNDGKYHVVSVPENTLPELLESIQYD